MSASLEAIIYTHAHTSLLEGADNFDKLPYGADLKIAVIIKNCQMRSSSVMISLLPPILLFAQIIIPASAHESENCYSGESGNNNACSRSSGDVVNDIVDDITAKSSTSQAMRDQRIRNLPPEYIEQLKEVDDYLTMEEENIDPIITCEEYLKMHDFVDPVDVSKSLYQGMRAVCRPLTFSLTRICRPFANFP